MIQIYNSLSKIKEPFQTVEPGKVRMYVCGMTVYDFCHLGHARMLISFDIIYRWLKQSGFSVNYVRNITDIDDKIIWRALEEGTSIKKVSEFYTAAMHTDAQALGVEAPNSEPRATQYVGNMLNIIDKLEKKGLAYRSDDGDVNYSVRNFSEYGKLSGRTLDDLRTSGRVVVGTAKQDPLDFVLWKSAKINEPSDSRWESPYGTGRPGWHIECSAMSETLLGLPLDIHGGGPDLKFPHHENEIAQTEGAFGGDFSNVWMHCGPLMVDADKMSKSLNNFRTIRQTIAVGKPSPDTENYVVNPREAEMVRFFIVRNHYRSPQNYSFDNLVDAQNSLDRLYQSLWNVPADNQGVNWDEKTAHAFKAAMDDDFNSAGAIAILFELASVVNRKGQARDAGQLKALAGLLGLLQQQPVSYFHSPTRYSVSNLDNKTRAELSQEIVRTLIKSREVAKSTRNFMEADKVREKLAEAGIEVIDLENRETEWRYI